MRILGRDFQKNLVLSQFAPSREYQQVFKLSTTAAASQLGFVL